MLWLETLELAGDIFEKKKQGNIEKDKSIGSTSLDRKSIGRQRQWRDGVDRVVDDVSDNL